MFASFRTRSLLSVSFIVLMVFTCLVVLGCSGGTGKPKAATAGPLAPGQAFGSVTLTGLDGKPAALESISGGKVTLVDIWATWCGPCNEALPHLQSLHNRFKDQGFTVIGVLGDQNATKIGAGFVNKKGLNYPMFLDDDAEKIKTVVGDVTGFPLLFLVGRDGKVLERFEGAVPPEQLEAAVEKALKG